MWRVAYTIHWLLLVTATYGALAADPTGNWATVTRPTNFFPLVGAGRGLGAERS